MSIASRSPSYLIRNPYTYCFRMIIPKDLQKAIGIKELRYSLGTGYIGLAKQKARYLAGNMQWLFNILRMNGNKMDKLTQEQMQQMINRFIRNKLDEVEGSRIEGGWTEPSQVEHNDKMLKGMIEMNQSDLVQTEYTNARSSVNKILEREGVVLDPDSFVYKNMCRKYLLSEIEMYRVEKKRNLSDYSDDVDKLFPIESKPEPLLSAVKKEPIPPGGVKLISEVVKEYIERTRIKWDDDGVTEETYLESINNLPEIVGDVPINSIRRKDVDNFRSTLQKLPTNRNKKPEYRDKTIAELLEMDVKKKLKVGTINNIIGRLGGLFKFAIRYEYYNGPNPFEGMRLPADKSAKERRAPYTNDELKRLFQSEQYLKDKFTKSYMFWTPIIALFHGMRQNEIAQLHLSDIYKSDDGIWIFDVTTDYSSDEDDDENVGGKRVKGTSKRKVPIHPFLLNELNLISYCDEIKASGEARLFPEINKPKKGGYGKPVSRWFNERYKGKKCGIKSDDDRMRDFHSFRTTYITHIGHKLLPRDLRLRIVGHSLGDDQTSSVYLEDFPPKQLFEEITLKVDFHKQIDLSHLTESKYVIKG